MGVSRLLTLPRYADVRLHIQMTHPTDAGPQAFVHQGPEGRCNGTYSNNLYWNASSPSGRATDTFPGADSSTSPGYPGVHLNFRNVNASFAEWQSSGQDAKSIQADPRFLSADPVGDNDFRMQTSSPAVTQLGFEPFDLTSGVGPDW